MKTEIFIGLGSNLNRPIDQINTAITELSSHPAVDFIQCSSLYRSRPMGPPDQPVYINAVARAATSTSPRGVLAILQQIENDHGRQRGSQHWGPRTLDLDLLLYGNHTIRSSQLRVPHPGIKFREFVLYPLYELNPDLLIPGQGTISRLVAKCYANGIQQLAD